MDKTKIANLLSQMTTCEIKIDEPMKNHTTFRIGGPVDIFAIPKSKEDIIETMRFSHNESIPLMTIGNGSNLIVRDGGIRGMVMKIYNNFSEIDVDGLSLTCKAGASLSKVANVALENSLAGFEFASGIPGTIGGAVLMNAGAYGGEMKDVVMQTTYLDVEGNEHILVGDDHQFGYRNSFFQNKQVVILETKLNLCPGNVDEIKSKMLDLNKKRKEKQPLQYPSAGSVFRRPEGYFVGKLIEDCGLKGYCVGGAQISELHAGFIINKDNASCKDVLNLIGYIQEKVKENFGVKLETEIKVVGED